MSIDTRTKDLRFSIRPEGSYWRLGATAPYSKTLLGADCPKNIGIVGTITSVRGKKPKGRLRFLPNPCVLQTRQGSCAWGSVENYLSGTAGHLGDSAEQIWNMRPEIAIWNASNYVYKLKGNPAAQVSNQMNYQVQTAWDNGLAALSVQRAYAGIHAAPMQGLVDAFELKQTIDMLKSPLKFILSHVAVKGKKKIKNRRPEKAPTLTSSVTKLKGGADSLANSWLQYVYGWLPLAGTIESAADALVAKLMDVPSFRSRDKSDIICDESSTTVTMQFGEFHCKFLVEVIESRMASTTLCYKVKYGDWRQYTGTRLSDLPMFAWEVIPYSFVADWFIGIGDWINSCMADAGLVRSSSTTCVWKRVSRTSLIAVSHITGKPVDFRNCSYDHVTKTMERRVNEKMSKTPLLNERFFNLYRKLSSMALVWGALSRQFRRTKNAPPQTKKRKPIPFAKHKGLV